MLNLPLISRILGFLLAIVGFFLIICSGLASFYEEREVWAFLYAALCNIGGGGLLLFLGRKAERRFMPRDGYLVVAATWVLCSAGGTLPFLFSAHITSFTDAFYTCMSSFTGTGFSCLPHIASLPHSILFWHTLMQWIGGLGIVFFTIAVLPLWGITGVQLFAVEATGMGKDRLHPRIGVTARRIWGLYLLLTLLQALLLQVGGMPLFDSICHALSTTSTGGFSTPNAVQLITQSSYLQYIVSIFMYLSGLNFIVLYLLLSGRARRVWQNDEVKWYTSSVLLFTGIVALMLIMHSGRDWEEGFRSALFHVASIHSSTGFSTEDLNLWPNFIWFILLALMVCGGCSGSTSGGIKSIRVLLLWRVIRGEFRRILHPGIVLPLHVNRRPITTQVVITSIILVLLFLILALVFAFLCMDQGHSFTGAISYSLAALGNTGVALGEFQNPDYLSSLSPLCKWLSSFMMLIGRLELFTVLLLFTPGFWRRGAF